MTPVKVDIAMLAVIPTDTVAVFYKPGSTANYSTL